MRELGNGCRSDEGGADITHVVRKRVLKEGSGKSDRWSEVAMKRVQEGAKAEMDYVDNG